MTKKKRATTVSRKSRKTKEVEREEEYQVEKILDHRTTDEGEKEYLIKWEGYSETTWEPVENCACPELIEAYEKAHSRKRDLEADTDNEEGNEVPYTQSKYRKTYGSDSGSETEEPESVPTKSRSNGSNLKSEFLKSLGYSSDEEDSSKRKDKPMVLDRSIASKDITMDDSDNSLDYQSRYYNKENDETKIIPEFEVEEEDEEAKKNDKFDKIVKRTAITSPTTVTSEKPSEGGGMVAEKVLKAGLLKDGLLHFIIKIEGLDAPQRYGAADANKLFPQQVISYYQTRIIWK